jgi:ABC-type bacteriocin/lantibiotic exporter with double-glycine peptidase domain
VLQVPHFLQTDPQGCNSCVPATVKMVLAFQGMAVDEEKLCSLLETKPRGTPALNVLLLNDRLPQCMVKAEPASVDDLRRSLQGGIPPISFVRTSLLPYWQGKDVMHALVVVEIQEGSVFVNDPRYSTAPLSIALADFLAAWDVFDNFTAFVQVIS